LAAAALVSWAIQPLAVPAASVDGAATPTALIDEINDLIDAAENEGIVAVHIEQRDPGREIFALESDRLLKPASNNKLQTTAAAFHYLGPARRFTTSVATNGAVDRAGCLRGDLILIGAGDPTISGRFHDGDVLFTMNEWIQTLKSEHGIRSIDGRIIGDDDLFDDQLIADSWFMDELGEWYSAESSALSFNDNCVDVHWLAARTVGAPPTHTLIPDTNYLNVISRVSTLAADADTDRRYRRPHDSNRVEVTGGIPHGTEVTDSAAVHNPTLYFATVFREHLSRNGITVLGEAADIDDLDPAGVRHNLVELCTSTSPPLSTVVDVINQRSQNFYADMVLKQIGVEVAGEGSFESGAGAVRHFLGEIGALPNEGWQMIDGSGLSPENQTTARALVGVLRHMDSRADGPLFRASLPRGRADRGSLRRRFGYSQRHRDAAGRILGKTGYIGGVWALSGIARNRAGVEFYYSIILNSYRSSTKPPLRLIDDIAVAVAASSFPGTAPLDPATTLH
jgi:D-alanyl-D-alanine carboxypeptidase/D-alanyl-D-alanine-endopeptidase (penicillin-binding protein 4)